MIWQSPGSPERGSMIRITGISGEGHVQGKDWLLIGTDQGDVVLKRIWSQIGKSADIEVSADFPLSEGEVLDIHQQAEWGTGAPDVKEPETKRHTFLM